MKAIVAAAYAVFLVAVGGWALFMLMNLTHSLMQTLNDATQMGIQ